MSFFYDIAATPWRDVIPKGTCIHLHLYACVRGHLGRGVDSPPPKHLDIVKGAPLRLPKPLSDQFPVRVCSCPFCI